MQAFANTFWRYSKSAFHWWKRELLSLFPVSIREAFFQAPDALTLYLDEDRFRIVRRSRNSEPPARRVVEEAASWPIFPEHDGALAPGEVSVWLPHSACLQRHFTVPAAAASNLEGIARLELERATPFKSEDVFLSYMAIPSPENRALLSVDQFIAKRETIADVKYRLREYGVTAAAITCLDKAGEKPLPINFLSGSEAARLRKSERLPMLAAIILLLVATAAAAAVVRSERALWDLVGRTSDARSEWRERQASVQPGLVKRQEANAIASLKAKYVPTVVLLNEITRLLPDDVHLTDLKIAERSIVISGLGRNTSRLIPLIEGSELFTDVRLAAPVTIDLATDRERFSISFAPRSRAEAARDPESEEQQL